MIIIDEISMDPKTTKISTLSASKEKKNQKIKNKMIKRELEV